MTASKTRGPESTAKGKNPTRDGSAKTKGNPRVKRNPTGQLEAGTPALNPNGRPRKGQAMTEMVWAWSQLPLPQLRAMLKRTSLPSRDAIAIRLILGAASTRGERDRIHLFDRVEGSVPKTVQVDDARRSELEQHLAAVAEALGSVTDDEEAEEEGEEPDDFGPDTTEG